MMQQTGIWHCFPFLFLLFTLHLSPILSYVLKDCTILYSENVTADVSVGCEHRQLVSIPDDIPREVIALSLKHNNILKIKRTDLNNLTNLRELSMDSNPIMHVDDGSFGHLGELKVLHMNYNKLTTLTDNMFQGLSNLLLLHLDHNNISFISPAAFQSLASLNELHLNFNGIHQMTDIITILQVPRLHVLGISILKLVSFQSKDLPLNMSSELRKLKINSPSIKKFSITTSVFPNLEKIDLTQCCNASGWEWDIPQKETLRNITKVHFGQAYMSFNGIRESLQSLDSLEYLQLSFMDKLINRGLLNIACKIPTLRTLDLNINHAPHLSGLTTCTQLTNLDLSSNSLKELSMDSIKHMEQLIHLNLNYNQLSKVPGDVKNLSMLQILNLIHNNINDLNCSDFLNLTRLTHLHLDQNQITEMKGCVFQPLSELKVLTMTDNFIHMLGNTFWTGSQKLELLDLNKNFIKELKTWDFKSLKSLKQLDVKSDEYLGWLDNTVFEGLVELQYLTLQGFRLQGERSAFEGLDKLETLSLIFLRSYDDLPLLKSLKSLTIQCDHQLFTPNISYITFKNTPNLEVLDLSNNKLKSLDFLEQSNLTRVSWLDLSQNELTVINVSVFNFLPALRYINMGDNPFACECSNSDVLQWILNNTQTQVVDAHNYTCGYPLKEKGTRFLDFDIHSCWVNPSFICYISSTCVIVLTLLTSFTYHFLRWQLLYAYYLFLAFLYDAQKRKRGSPQRYDAFISYNVHDEPWVYREMLPVLEGEQGWRLCLHHRDFQPGKAIIENITEAIYGSRKTICVISRRYLESEWCSREIQMASYRLFDEKKDVLILVFLEDIPAQQLSPYFRMRRLVKRHTYLSWSQAGQHPGLFWQNLRRALDTPDTDLCLDE